MDYGETWERVWVDSIKGDLTVGTLSVTDSIVFAVSRRSDVAVRSRDKGATWDRLTFLPGHNHYVWRNSFTQVADMVFVGTNGGVLRSIDGGDTWEEASDGLSKPVYQLAAVGSVLVAGTYRGGIYTSDDQGLSWAPSTKGIESMSHMTVDALTSFKGVIYSSIGGRIHSSQDGGSTWEICGDTSATYFGISFAGYRGGVYVADCGGGVFRLDESTLNWKSHNTGLSAHVITSLLAGSKGIWATTYFGGLFSLNSICYKSVREYRAYTLHQCVARDNQAMYCGTDRGLFRRIHGQTEWHEDNEGIPIPPAGTNMVARVSSIWLGDTLEFIAVSGILYRRGIGSKHWIRSSADPQGTGGLSHVVFVKGRVLAGGAGLHVSEDTCKTWNQVIAESGGINGILARDSLVFCANSKYGVYFSTDAGSTWEKPNQKLEGVEALAVVGRACFAGTKSRGLFVSNDTARTWVRVDGVPDNVPILSMAVSDSVLYLGTDGRGVWTFDVRDMSASAKPVPRSPSKSKYIVPPGREEFDLLGRKLISPKRATSISVDETRKYIPLAK